MPPRTSADARTPQKNTACKPGGRQAWRRRRTAERRDRHRVPTGFVRALIGFETFGLRGRVRAGEFPPALALQKINDAAVTWCGERIEAVNGLRRGEMRTARQPVVYRV